jgi:Tol biopolymer transport system component
MLAYLAAFIVIVPLFAARVHAQVAGRSVIPVASQWPESAGAWQIDISDDGRYVVYQTNRGEGWRLFLHELGQPTSREIVGLGDTPYFGHISPNGEWLLFGKKNWIWKAPLAGGQMTLVHAANNSNEWETNGTFLVASGAEGLWRVKADGSMQREQVSPLDPASGATNYARPSLLPGGKGVLVSVGFGTGMDLRKIGVLSIPGGKLTLIDEYGINPRYSDSGHILYTQGSTLNAMPFDPDGLRVLGPGVPVIEGVHVYTNGASQFDISRNGVLVYVPGRSELNREWPSRLTWVDRSGNETPFDTTAEKLFGLVRLSPNGRYLAAQVTNLGLQLFDRQSGTWSTLSEGTDIRGAVWAGDSRSLFYSKAQALGRQSIDPVAAWKELWPGEGSFWGFSLAGDGHRLLGTEWRSDEARWRFTSLGLEGPSRAEPFLDADGVNRRAPTVSPDGKWLAYVEKVGGLDRVYVQPFPNGGTPVLASAGAAEEAAEPMWGRSSDELFYRDAVHMVSVELETAPTLRLKRRTPLFEIRNFFRYLTTYASVYDYDPRTDRFLMARWVSPDRQAQDIQVVYNAFELLNRLAPHR